MNQPAALAAGERPQLPPMPAALAGQAFYNRAARQQRYIAPWLPKASLIHLYPHDADREGDNPQAANRKLFQAPQLLSSFPSNRALQVVPPWIGIQALTMPSLDLKTVAHTPIPQILTQTRQPNGGSLTTVAHTPIPQILTQTRQPNGGSLTAEHRAPLQLKAALPQTAGQALLPSKQQSVVPLQGLLSSGDGVSGQRDFETKQQSVAPLETLLSPSVSRVAVGKPDALGHQTQVSRLMQPHQVMEASIAKKKWSATSATFSAPNTSPIAGLVAQSSSAIANPSVKPRMLQTDQQRREGRSIAIPASLAQPQATHTSSAAKQPSALHVVAPQTMMLPFLATSGTSGNHPLQAKNRGVQNEKSPRSNPVGQQMPAFNLTRLTSAPPELGSMQNQTRQIDQRVLPNSLLTHGEWNSHTSASTATPGNQMAKTPTIGSPLLARIQATSAHIPQQSSKQAQATNILAANPIRITKRALLTQTQTHHQTLKPSPAGSNFAFAPSVQKQDAAGNQPGLNTSQSQTQRPTFQYAATELVFPVAAVQQTEHASQTAVPSQSDANVLHYPQANALEKRPAPQQSLPSLSKIAEKVALLLEQRGKIDAERKGAF